MIFFCKSFLLSCLLIASALSTWAEAEEVDDMPSVSDLVSLHIENNNGQYNLNKLSSIYAIGRILYFDTEETVERSFRIYKKRPNKYRSYYETKMGKELLQLEVIYNGTEAIQILSHGGREVYREKLEGEALESVKFEAKMEGPFLLASENPDFLTVIGYEMIEDQKCILLSLDEQSPYPYRNIWLNADNYQEVKFDRYISDDQGGLLLEEVYFKNFKTIQNVLFASRMDKDIDGKRTFSTFIDNFEVNCGLFNSLFSMPDELGLDSVVE